MEKTAVEWLVEVVAKMGYVSTEILEQAKEMEKEQAVDFAYDIADDLACGVFSKKDIEDRYTEFFKSE